MPTTYVNKPGGILAKFKDGEVKQLKYGDPVPTDQLADHVDPTGWSDGQSRVAAPSQELEAHRRAALTENGQVNSSSSAVPSNYGELDEDAAAQLMSNLSSLPEMQLALLKHEVLFGGNRQKVLDASGEYAKVGLAVQLASVRGTPADTSDLPEVDGPSATSLGDPLIGTDRESRAAEIQARADAAASGRITPPPSGDPDRGVGTVIPDGTRTSVDEGGADSSAEVEALKARIAELEEQAALAERHGTGEGNGDPSNENVDYDKFKVPQLDAYIEQHQLPVDKALNKEDKIAALRQVEGHEKPVTPPDPDKA